MSKRLPSSRSSDPQQLPLFGAAARPSGPSVPQPMDREPILRDWRMRCRTIESALHELLAELESFETEALPGFRGWLAAEFGAELSALREVESKIAEAELIRDATKVESRASRIPLGEAYRRVMARKKRGEDLFPETFFGEDSADWDAGWQEVDPHTDYRLEEPECGSVEEEESGAAESETESDSLSEKPPLPDVSTAASRLKSLYRKLAFALHPDSNPALSERDRGIWDQVQMAYAAKDLERLEVLLAWVESGAEGWLESITHIGTLQRLFAEKTAELRATRAASLRLRGERAWKFWKAKLSAPSLACFRDRTELELVQESMRAIRKLQSLEARFAEWLSGRGRP